MDFKACESVNKHSRTFEHKVIVSNTIILLKVEM